MVAGLDLVTIRIGQGIGDLSFGLTRDEARQLLGPEYRIIEGSDDPETEIWLYEPLGLALGFAAEHGGRLGSIETTRPEAILEGERIIGLTIMEAAIKLRALFDFPIEAVFGEDEEVPEQLRLPDLEISFWNEGVVVESISLGVMEGDGGDPLWPVLGVEGLARTTGGDEVN